MNTIPYMLHIIPRLPDITLLKLQGIINQEIERRSLNEAQSKANGG